MDPLQTIGGMGAVAVIIALVGLFMGHRGKGSKPAADVEAVAEAKEIMDDHVEEVAKAGTDYTNSMVLPVDERVRDILSKFRKRTNK
jgi:hypothetical protein